MSKSLRYFLSRHILFRPFLTATADEDFFGLKYRFKTQDCVGRAIYKRGAHERVNTEFLLKHLDFSKARTIFDIGANIGWYSLILDHKAMPGSKIFSFEPDDLNYDLLTTNIALNEAKSIEAIKLGVSDRAETKKLYLYPNKNRGRHSMLADESLETIDVETTTIDSFCSERGINDIYFMKMDIEGYEFFALKGAQEMLRKTRFLLTEYSPTLYKSHSAQDLLDLIFSAGFEPFEIRGQQLQSLKREALINSDRHLDIFWQRKTTAPTKH